MNEKSVEERLAAHPELKEKVLALLELVEANPDGHIERADDMEERIIQNTTQLRQQLMQDWAQGRERQTAQSLRESAVSAVSNGKKNSTGTRVLEP